MKPWQRGYDLELLRELRAPFLDYDRGLILGAFTAVKENTIAGWLADGQLEATYDAHGHPAAVAHARVAQRSTSVKDFTGAHRLRLPPGTLIIDRYAARLDASPAPLLAELLGSHSGPVMVCGWLEHPETAQLAQALGLELGAVKIRASSELVGCWHRGGHPVELPESERWTIRTAAAEAFSFDPEPLAAEVAAAAPAWADHYSSYNQRHSWTAVALRGFGEPEFIQKPAEMSRRWKAENPERLAATCEWTDAAALLPECAALARSLPAPLERVRLMRLAPGDGELTRHADITDPDAGTTSGHLLRIHLPLVTHDRVRFTGWAIDGTVSTYHMPAGRLSYLDTRKPHAAINAGDSERIHLVCDAWATSELLELLA